MNEKAVTRVLACDHDIDLVWKHCRNCGHTMRFIADQELREKIKNQIEFAYDSAQDGVNRTVVVEGRTNAIMSWINELIK